MPFLDKWRKQLPESLAQFAELAEGVRGVDFTYGVLATGLLWPIRSAIQEFDGDAINAAKEVIGEGGERILQIVGRWPEAREHAARLLATEAKQQPTIRMGLDRLIMYFDATPLFAEQLAQQIAKRHPEHIANTTYNITDEIRAALVNIGGITNIDQLTVHLSLPPAREPSAVQKWGRIGLACVMLTGAVLVIVQFVRPLIAAPVPMSGAFNIAVADFGKLDENGRVISAKEASALADSVQTLLETELKPAPGGFDIRTQGPDATGRIAGATPSERAQAAEKLAAEINADVIVYGNLDRDNTTFVPEFYLSERSLRNAEELLGQHQFGPEIITPDDITMNSAAYQELNDGLRHRTKVLAQFAIGLSYYALFNYDKALTYLEAAQRLEGWGDRKELLYLFLGNTLGKLNRLDDAEHKFRSALEVEPEYARARVGLASVQLQRAKGSCEAGKIDAEGMRVAMEVYKGALTAKVQPLLADIEAKVHFGLGQSYLCLSQALVGDYWHDAEQAFLAVITEYEGGNPRVREMTAQAQANLGAIYLPLTTDVTPEPEFQRAADQYRKAFELSRQPAFQAICQGMLGYIYTRLKEYEQADAAYATAISLAPDPTARTAYEQSRRNLQQERGAQR